MYVDLQQLQFIGSGLNRPECVLAHVSGLLMTPDWTEPGGISVVSPSGQVYRILATNPESGVDMPLRPNGIALEPGGTILIAHLGAERGGIYRLSADGHVAVITDQVDGAPMPPANFVARDSQDRVWFTVSTTKVPRADDYRADACSGFIALHQAGQTTIAADGLGYTNECLLSADESTLWVNETFARRLTAFDLIDDRLVNKRVIAEFGRGIFPDGLAEAQDGSLLITSIVSNSVLRVRPDGSIETVVQDAEDDHVDWVEAAYQADEMGRPHLDGIKSSRLSNISNLAFGGPHLSTGYLGCLLGDSIARFDSPLAGRPLPHWSCDLGPLAQFLEDPS